MRLLDTGYVSGCQLLRVDRGCACKLKEQGAILRYFESFYTTLKSAFK